MKLPHNFTLLRPKFLLCSKFLLFLFLGLVLVTCEKPKISSTIKDYLHYTPDGEIFRYADDLKYGRYYRKAIKAFQKVIDKKTLNNEQRCYAYNQLAYLHHSLNENDLAKVWIDSLEASFNDKLSVGAQADYYYNRGVHALRSFHPKHAERNLKLAIKLYRQVYHNGDHLKKILAYTNYGMFHYNFHRRNEAFYWYVGTAYGSIIRNPSLWPHTVETEIAMANLSIWKRKFDAAIIHGANAVHLAVNQPNVNKIYYIKGNLIGLRITAGTSGKPEILKKTAEIIQYKSRQIQTINDLINLDIYRYMAVCYLRAKDSTNFFSVINSLMRLEKKWPNITPYSQHLIGRYHKEIKDYDKAIEKLKLCLTQYERDSIVNTKILDDTYQEIANCFIAKENYDSAFIYVIRNITFQTNYENSKLKPSDILSKKIFKCSSVPFWTLQRAGEIFLKQGIKEQDTLKLGFALRAFQIADSLTFVDSPMYDDDIIQHRYEEIGNTLYPGALEAIHHLIQLQPKKSSFYKNLASHFFDRSKSDVSFRFLPENLASNRLRKLKLDIESLKAKKNLNFKQNRQLAFQSYRLSKIIKAPKLKYYFFKSEDIQSFIKQGESVLQFKIGDSATYLLYVNSDTILFHRIPVTQAKLSKETLTFRESIEKRGDNSIKDFFKSSKQLFDWLVSPIYEQIKKYPNCTFIPDGSLNLIPFEALLVEKTVRLDKNTPYLITAQPELVISYSPSWKILSVNRQESPPSFKPAAYFSYGGNKGEFTCSFREKKILPRLFSTDTFKVFEFEDCTKEAFLAMWKSKKFQTVALSLHADANAQVLLDSKIWFGSSKDDPLFAFEIAHSKGRANLVILSACKSGTGRIRPGDGVYSLAQGFCQGGAKAVIAALWDIDHCTNVDILEKFYVNKIGSLAKALSIAKRNFLKKSGNNHPSYWAGVIHLN